ncbi:MAG TPA: TlpA family protein disulfide reductase [Myxococcales bacterium]|nr:TlpA family protein disulfide reductase [Myxococcales bacterium]
MRTRHNQRNRACRWTLQFTCSLIVLALSSPAIAIEPGQKAPNFRAQKLEGKGTLGLSQYRGKVVYLDFWASWCAPCLEAVPALEALRGEFPESKFQILAVNVDKETRKAMKFLEKQKVGYPSVRNPKGDIPEKFDLDTMPSSYLIDQEGVVRYVHKGFRDGDLEVIREEVRRIIK